MTQAIVQNRQQLDILVRDMYRLQAKCDQKNKGMCLFYREDFKEKTPAQLGFIFGALVDSILEFYEEKGRAGDTKKSVARNFCEAIASADDRFLTPIQRFDGKIEYVAKSISDMSIEEASLFIDYVLRFVDSSPLFESLCLHPSIRYTWVRHLSRNEILQAGQASLPRQDKEYLAEVRTRACIWCGIANQSEAHHLKAPGESGIGYKSDDWCAVPLCNTCHIGRLHQGGQDAFLAAMKWATKYVGLVDFCRINYLRWKNKI